MDEHNYFAQQGWECPKCGRILAPSMMWCPWCANKETEVTTTTGTNWPSGASHENVYGRGADSVGNEYWFGTLTGKHKIER